MSNKVDTKVNSQWVIYLLVWFFLGAFWIHRFVAWKIGSWIAILSLQIIWFITMFVLIGFVFLWIAWVWWLVDGIMILMWKFQESDWKVINMKVSVSPETSNPEL
jgi:TM2 domain-containing membrane protein YozV